MSRTLLGWFAVCLLVFAGGCAMCAGPYDEVGPTMGALAGDVSHPGMRAGSILAGHSGVAYPGAYQEREMLGPPSAPPVPTTAPPRPQPPASPSPSDATRFFPEIPPENILSITDHKLGEGSAAPPAESAPKTRPAQRSNTTYAQPASSGGWNARDPRARHPR